jgi:hypothetical protein
LEERHEENAFQAGAHSAAGYRRRNSDPALNACPQIRPRCANERFELDPDREIASVRETGKTKLQFNGMEIDARVSAGTIRVNRVLKGNAPAEGFSFQIYTSDTYIGWASPITNSYAIYFLKQILPKILNSPVRTIPTFRLCPTSVVSDGAPIDKVIAAIKEVLSSPEATLDQKKRTIFFES